MPVCCTLRFHVTPIKVLPAGHNLKYDIIHEQCYHICTTFIAYYKFSRSEIIQIMAGKPVTHDVWSFSCSDKQLAE